MPSVSLLNFAPTITGKYCCFLYSWGCLGTMWLHSQVGLWLSLWWWAQYKYKKHCLSSQNCLKINFQSRNTFLSTHPPPRQHLTHRHTLRTTSSLESISSSDGTQRGVFMAAGKLSSVTPLQVIFKKMLAVHSVLLQPQKIELSTQNPPKIDFLSQIQSEHHSANPPEGRVNIPVLLVSVGTQRGTNTQCREWRDTSWEKGSISGKK